MKSVREIITESIIANSFSISHFDKFIIDSEFSNRLTYHRILLIESGAGILSIDDKSFEIKSHEVFLMSKGQIYQFEKSSIISGYVIGYNVNVDPSAGHIDPSMRCFCRPTDDLTILLLFS